MWKFICKDVRVAEPQSLSDINAMVTLNLCRSQLTIARLFDGFCSRSSNINKLEQKQL